MARLKAAGFFGYKIGMGEPADQKQDIGDQYDADF
jgi:hypothetical protein